MISRLLFILLLVTPCALAQSQRDAVDIQHYNFTLELNDSTDIIAGKAIIQLSTLKSLKQIAFDLTSKNAEGRGMVVKEVNVNGKALTFTHDKNMLTVTLPENSAARQHLSISIFYSGIPQDGLVIAKNKFGDRTFFGDNWPDRARHWLPCIDHPSDKAAVDFTVLAPTQYEVIGNGLKVEESYLNEKQKLTHWREETPIPTKVMVVGAARFAIYSTGKVNDIEIQSWVYPQNRAAGFHDYAPATRILDFFNSHIGPYSYKKLANVQSKTRYGGMENASNIFYFENSVTGNGTVEKLIAHEVAHQWFGNSASEKDWHHVWLSESFATYCTHLYTEFTYGADAAAVDRAEDRKQVLEYEGSRTLPIVFQQLPTELIKILSVNSYQKGGWVLHMLRKNVGDDAFWKGLRNYYSAYKNSNAETEDFRRHMEQASGKDLTSFFKQWIYTPGQPKISVSWRYNAKTKSLELAVEQTQKEEAFAAPLTIAITFANDELSDETVQLTKKSEKFSIPVQQKPLKIALDPHVDLLFEGGLKN